MSASFIQKFNGDRAWPMTVDDRHSICATSIEAVDGCIDLVRQETFREFVLSDARQTTDLEIHDVRDAFQVRH